MADRNPLWVSHTPGGVVTIDDARIGVSALWAPGSSAVNARKGLRPSGSTATTTPGYVAQQTVADKTVKINAFQAAIPMSRATGSFIVTMDAVKTIDLLTAHPAHATLQRNDLIVAQVSDEAVDAANGFSVVQIVGTPNASPSDPTVNITNGAPTNSPDYITLARVRVTANANTIITAMIDDLRPPWLVALGGVLPILNVTDRGTLTPYDGLTIWRIDRKWLEAYSIAAGGWLVQGVGICSSVSDANTAITTPVSGQQIVIANIEYVYDGTAWVVMPGQTVGGQYRTTVPAGVAATETVLVSTGAVSLDRNSIYKVTFSAIGDMGAASCDFDFRIRETNVTGTISKEQVMPRNIDLYPVGHVLTHWYATSVAETKTWVGTTQRIVGTGNFTPRIGTSIQVEKVGFLTTMSTV